MSKQTAEQLEIVTRSLEKILAELEKTKTDKK